MKNLTVKELTEQILVIAKRKGFGASLEEVSVPEKIALIHSQVSSAYEGYRKNKLKGEWSVENELAGAVFMIIQLYAVLGLNFEESILQKIKEIEGREWNQKKIK